tara:strand:+ start:291 stop:3446 length:3156 start_codon:yes stop_codon:yes gene_type:complete
MPPRPKPIPSYREDASGYGGPPRIPGGEVPNINIPSGGAGAAAGFSRAINANLSVITETHKLRMGSLKAEKVIESTSKAQELFQHFTENANGIYIDDEFELLESGLDKIIREATTGVPGADDLWYSTLKNEITGPTSRILAEAAIIKFERHLDRRRASFYGQQEIDMQNGNWAGISQNLTDAINSGLFTHMDVRTIEADVNSNYFQSGLTSFVLEKGRSPYLNELPNIPGFRKLPASKQIDIEVETILNETGQMGQEALAAINSTTERFLDDAGDPNTMGERYRAEIEEHLRFFSPLMQETLLEKADQKFYHYKQERIINRIPLEELTDPAELAAALEQIVRNGEESGLNTDVYQIAAREAHDLAIRTADRDLSEEATKTYQKLLLELGLIKWGGTPEGMHPEANVLLVMESKIKSFIQQYGAENVGVKAHRLYAELYGSQGSTAHKAKQMKAVLDLIGRKEKIPHYMQEIVDDIPRDQLAQLFQEIAGHTGAPWDIASWVETFETVPKAVIEHHKGKVFGTSRSGDITDKDYNEAEYSLRLLVDAGRVSPRVQGQIGEEKYRDMYLASRMSWDAETKFNAIRSPSTMSQINMAARSTLDTGLHSNLDIFGFETPTDFMEASWKALLHPGTFTWENVNDWVHFASLGVFGDDARDEPSAELKAIYHQRWTELYVSSIGRLESIRQDTDAFKEQVDSGTHDEHIEAAARYATDILKSEFRVENAFGAPKVAYRGPEWAYGSDANKYAPTDLAKFIHSEVSHSALGGDPIASVAQRHQPIAINIKAMDLITDPSNHGYKDDDGAFVSQPGFIPISTLYGSEGGRHAIGLAGLATGFQSGRHEFVVWTRNNFDDPKTGKPIMVSVDELIHHIGEDLYLHVDLAPKNVDSRERRYRIEPETADELKIDGLVWDEGRSDFEFTDKYREENFTRMIDGHRIHLNISDNEKAQLKRTILKRYRLSDRDGLSYDVFFTPEGRDFQVKYGTEMASFYSGMGYRFRNGYITNPQGAPDYYKNLREERNALDNKNLILYGLVSEYDSGTGPLRPASYAKINR